MFNRQIAKAILQALLQAQENGGPLPLAEALKRWCNCPTWFELVDKDHVEHANGSACITPSGRVWYAEN
jgi:hypothetical protein